MPGRVYRSHESAVGVFAWFRAPSYSHFGLLFLFSHVVDLRLTCSGYFEIVRAILYFHVKYLCRYAPDDVKIYEV